MAEMALIVPPKGEAKQTAKRLLALAADPGVVQTTADGPDGVSFVVPDDLYDTYMNDGADQMPPHAPAVEVVDEGGLPAAPRRRGRPPGSKNKTKDAETEE